LLIDIGLVIASATVFAAVARYFKQPLILAYVAAGAVLGPFVFNVIENTNEVLILSELGVAFLLFGAGIEINLKKFKEIGGISAITGAVQVGLIVLFSYLIMSAIGLGFTESIYIAVALAFSSTMIVLKILSDSKKLNTLDGRIMIGILIIQDVLVIILLPLLENISNIGVGIFMNTIISGIALIGIALVAEQFIFKRLLKFVAKSHELLFLIAITTCFAFMAIANLLGFSIAIGAFVGGISLSIFHYNVEIGGRIKVLRDFFATIFFVTLGMQLIPFGGDVWIVILLMFLIVLILKPFIITIMLEILGYNPHISINCGLGLANMSEFSFIIASTGLFLGHISPEIFSGITITIMGTIVLTPYFMKHHEKTFFTLKKMWDKLPFTIKIESKRMPEGDFSPKENDQIILVGCDRMGGRILENIDKKKLVVIDYNPDVIEFLKKKKINCIYGDVYNENVLELMPLKQAKMLILTIPDEEIVNELILRSKQKNPKTYVIAKAETIEDAILLYETGADLVILPEFVAGDKVCDCIKVFTGNAKEIQKHKKRHLYQLEKELKEKDVKRKAHLIQRILHLKR